MADTCSIPMLDGSECGRPSTHSGDCWLHHLRHSPIKLAHFEALERYVADTRSNHIEFSKFEFEGFGFEERNLPKLKKYTFNRCRFTDCILITVDFGAESAFQGCTFVNTNFSFCRFHGSVNFGIDNLSCIFEKCEFENLVFEGVASFGKCLLNECKFHGQTVFEDTAEMPQARFNHTSFDSVVFEKGVNFKEAVFSEGMVPFETCEFIAGPKDNEDAQIVFDRAIFKDSAMPFPSCTMSGHKASFENSVFESSSLNLLIYESHDSDAPRPQYLSVSTEIINLYNVSFNGHFDLVQKIGYRDFVHTLHLGRLMFSSMASVAFIGVNLERASFTNSVIDKVNFINCKWDRRPKNSGRQIVYDDKSRTSDVSMTEVLRQYIQLKKNFENQRDFVGAGDWSYREMECRESLAKKRLYRFGLRWYRRLAQYGEAYWTPLKWLGVVWFIAAYFYLMNGFQIGDTLSIDYDYRWSWSYDPAVIRDFLWSLLFSFGAMLFLIGKNLKLTNAWGVVVYIIQLLGTITLVPLFLLALRRKFRR